MNNHSIYTEQMTFEELPIKFHHSLERLWLTLVSSQRTDVWSGMIRNITKLLEMRNYIDLLYTFKSKRPWWWWVKLVAKETLVRHKKSVNATWEHKIRKVKISITDSAPERLSFQELSLPLHLMGRGSESNPLCFRYLKREILSYIFGLLIPYTS